MPIVNVYALRSRGRAILDTVGPALARALSIPEKDVWVYVVEIDTAETAGNRGQQGHCPYAVIRGRAGRSEAVIRTALAAVGNALSDAQSVPLADVWVQWEDVPPGRAFAGGDVV